MNPAYGGYLQSDKDGQSSNEWLPVGTGRWTLAHPTNRVGRPFHWEKFVNMEKETDEEFKPIQ